LVKLIGGGGAHYASGWIRATCPFAKWKHKSGKDSHPSFGVSVYDNEKSYCNCYTCGSKGDMFTMVMEIRDLQRMDGIFDVNIKEAMDLVLSEDSEKDVIPDILSYEESKVKEGKEFVTYSEHWLKSFPTAYNHPYVLSRGVTPEVAEALDLRIDIVEQRICVPIRTSSGILAGLQGRDITNADYLRYKLYGSGGKYNPDVWLMEHTVDQSDPVVICEGFFDLAKIYAAYPNVVGSLTTQITKSKARRLRDAEVIITFFDHGTGGDKGRSLVDTLWPDSFIQHILPPEGYSDAGEMPSSVIGEILDELI
jgi:DNA primase